MFNLCGEFVNLLLQPRVALSHGVVQQLLHVSSTFYRIYDFLAHLFNLVQSLRDSAKDLNILAHQNLSKLSLLSRVHVIWVRVISEFCEVDNLLLLSGGFI